MNALTLVLKRSIKYFLHKSTISWKEFTHGLKTDLDRLKMYKSVLRIFSNNNPESEKYKPELQYIIQNHTFTVFPYDACGHLPFPKIGFDDSCHLPYLLHDNKRLFFPEDWNQIQISNYYINTVSIENILETDDRYLKKTPHRYQSQYHKIEQGDILIDAGSAEGLFALDNIEKASEIIIVECDKKWERPLKETFKPYMDKVKLVFKMLGNEDSENSISLDSILNNTNPTTTFVKMDIEGAEVKTIESCVSYLEKCDRNLKISCCTYHNTSDFEKLHSIFNQLNCQIECSDGYMLIYDYAEKRPDFRHGLIRARITPRQ